MDSPSHPLLAQPRVSTLLVSHVVAMSTNHAIGIGGRLPWHIPEDFKIFKRLTHGHALIMGRKTFESIGKPLPGRLSIVVTRQPAWPAPEGVLSCASVGAALCLAEERRGEWGEEVFVIGGGEIFRETLGYVDKVYQTLVHQEVAGDAFYPVLPLGEFALERELAGLGDVPFTWRVWTRLPR